MIDRDYLARLAALLLKLARSTKDRGVAIALIDKAAELQERIAESDLADVAPLAPDMEPPDRSPGHASSRAYRSPVWPPECQVPRPRSRACALFSESGSE